jgi:hypothetical protein
MEDGMKFIKNISVVFVVAAILGVVICTSETILGVSFPSSSARVTYIVLVEAVGVAIIKTVDYLLG